MYTTFQYTSTWATSLHARATMFVHHQYQVSEFSAQSKMTTRKQKWYTHATKLEIVNKALYCHCLEILPSQIAYQKIFSALQVSNNIALGMNLQ